MERYIGLDVHASSCTAAIIYGRGKRLGSQVIETNGSSLVEFLKIQPGRVHLCLEEVTQSAWLSEILSPHVTGHLNTVATGPDESVAYVATEPNVDQRELLARLRLEHLVDQDQMASRIEPRSAT